MMLIDIDEKGIINKKKIIDKELLKQVIGEKSTGGYKKRFTRRKYVRRINKFRKSKVSR
jgi:hypothetical protein